MQHARFSHFAPLAIVFAMLFLAFSMTIEAQDSPNHPQPKDLRIESLQAGVWLVVHAQPFSSNALLIEMENGDLLLCDTPTTEEATLRLLGWIHEQFGNRHLVVINGHFHPDCLAGNAAMIDAGAEVWASDLTPGLLDGREEGFRASLLGMEMGDDINEEIRQTRFTAPGQVFDHRITHRMRFGDEEAHVFWPGPGHAPDNVVTFVPSKSIVFAGCLCFSMDRSGVGNIRDADLIEWPSSIDRVAALGAEMVIPGHGKPGGPELFVHTKAVLLNHAADQD